MLWNLSGIYNKMHSLVWADKIDSPREYFRVLYLQSGVLSDILKWISYFIKEVNSNTGCGKFLVKYKNTYLIKRFYLQDHVSWDKDCFQIDENV